MICSDCSAKCPMYKMVVIGEGWKEKWICPKCADKKK